MYNNKRITAMNKKNYLWSLLTIVMLAVLSVGFVSCGDDDDDEITGGSELVDKLQGTWQFQKGTETVMGMTITMDRSSLSEMKKSMEQMMGTRVEFWDETLSFSGSKVNGVNYKLDGNKLILENIVVDDFFHQPLINVKFRFNSLEETERISNPDNDEFYKHITFEYE